MMAHSTFIFIYIEAVKRSLEIQEPALLEARRWCVCFGVCVRERERDDARGLSSVCVSDSLLSDFKQLPMPKFQTSFHGSLHSIQTSFRGSLQDRKMVSRE